MREDISNVYRFWEQVNLRAEFERGLEQLEKDKPKQYKILMGELLNYGTVIGCHKSNVGTLWDTLREQIKYQAKKHGTTPIKIIRGLFTSDDADIFMGRLQI